MKKYRQYRSRQGRTPESEHETFKLLRLVGFLATIIILAYYIYTLIQ